MFKKIFGILMLAFLLQIPVFAQSIPEDVQKYIEQTFPNTNFRFDGVIILPDNTEYIPLFPAKIINPETIKIKQTYPINKDLKAKPNVVILNNDFVLMKLLTDTKGHRTIYKMANPPLEITTGLLPQDMLVPEDFVIPENMKSIIGNLDITTSADKGVRIQNNNPIVTQLSGSTLKALSQIPALKNKNFYASSPYSKNIRVFNLGAKTPEYSIKQESVPISIKTYNNEFLLVTSFDKSSMDVISLADDKIIKQVVTNSQPDEILIDYNKNTAYISSSENSSIYVLNLSTMNLFKQIKITGMCEKLTLSDDGSKIFYYDKKSNDIWSIELDNNYLLKEIGKFPNVSKIVFTNNKVYITSRTKNRIAIVDYETSTLINEFEICDKPIDMLSYKGKIYVLGAEDNSLQIINSETDEVTDTIYLNTNGFSTKISYIDGSNIALITDTKASLYTVFDLDKDKVIYSIPIDIPVNNIVVTQKVKKL